MGVAQPDPAIAGLVEQLERERQRSDQAERALQRLRRDVEHGQTQAPAWFASVGTEIDRMLDDAGRAAAKLLAEAGRRIQTATDAADAQAAERLKAAEERAQELEATAHAALAHAQTERARIEAAAAKAAEERLAQADREAEALLARAQDEARRAEEHTARERQQLEADRWQLTTLRESMVEQLVQVYAPLGLKLVDIRGELPPPAQNDDRPGPGDPALSGAADALEGGAEQDEAS
jgi:hypothetical protein